MCQSRLSEYAVPGAKRGRPLGSTNAAIAKKAASSDSKQGRINYASSSTTTREQLGGECTPNAWSAFTAFWSKSTPRTAPTHTNLRWAPGFARIAPRVDLHAVFAAPSAFSRRPSPSTQQTFGDAVTDIESSRTNPAKLEMQHPLQGLETSRSLPSENTIEPPAIETSGSATVLNVASSGNVPMDIGTIDSGIDQTMPGKAHANEVEIADSQVHPLILDSARVSALCDLASSSPLHDCGKLI